MKNSGIIAFSLLVFIESFGQSHFRAISVSAFPGFLIAHREYMANMEAHVGGFEIMYNSNQTGWKQVEDNYKNLKWGTGFSYFNLGNNAINGSIYAWHIHLEANLKKRRKFQSAIRFGSGIGYFNNPYNLVRNKTNKAIGSHFNGNIQLMWNTYHDLDKTHQLILGIGVTHYSNGNFKRPNLGVNNAHLAFGINRKFNLDKKLVSKDLPQLFPKNGFEVLFGVANKQIDVADTRRFTILSGSVLAYFKHSETRNWRVGVESFFDKTYPYQLFRPEALKNLKLKEYTELALKVGHEFMFGRVAIVTDIGAYVYRPNEYKKRVYFKIGFNYCFNKGFIAQTRLKTHMAVADYFHWGVGYRFKNPLMKE